MKKLQLGLMALTLAAASAIYAAEEPSVATGSGLRADHPETYTVVKGDSLWAISGRFLSEPWRWKELWQMNPNIKNPDKIYPGDIIKVVYVDGKPHLTVDRGAAGSGSGMGAGTAAKDCTTQSTQKTGADGVVKLSPKCHAVSLEDAIPSIPLEAMAPFLSENRVVDSADEIKNAPYIITGGHVISGQGDSMFARGHFDPAIPVYDIYRTGKTYSDPVTGEMLGVELRNIGKGKVISSNEEVSRVEMIRTSQEILSGDKLIAGEETKLASYFLPQAPEKPVSGHVLDVLSGVTQVGQYNIVLLSLGERDGVKVGTVLAVYERSGTGVDPETKTVVKLPSEKAGLLMVFRTFEKMSYGIVMQSSRPLGVMSEVKNP